jgi:hypothetical protein
MIMKNSDEIIRSMKQCRDRLFRALDDLRNGEITIKEANEINKAMDEKIKDAKKELNALRKEM